MYTIYMRNKPQTCVYGKSQVPKSSIPLPVAVAVAVPVPSRALITLRSAAEACHKKIIIKNT